ncbi:c-type cytochrome [Arhodomonas sp. AD133]|uniref:c-type cytochrome n=1 Tax=Arhodomonas sp. AD133 TaxID=3415009 RepID=UPI003EB824B9
MSRPLAALGLVAAVGTAVPAAAADGKALFAQRCAACHQADASGASGFIPPLRETLGHFLAVDGGDAYLVNVVTNGLVGRIDVGGQAYASNMPAFGGDLDAAEIAAVLRYVLTRFNDGSAEAAGAITREQVATLADDSLTANAVHRTRRTVTDRLAAEGLKR